MLDKPLHIYLSKTVRFDPVSVLSLLYSCQRDVITSRSDDNVVCNPRQTGKTTLVVSACIYFALKYGQRNKVVGYFCDSRRHAMDLLWYPLLFELDRLGIPYKSNTTDLVITFENGCKVELFGIDDARKASRLRGYQWVAVFIDEAQSIPNDVLKKVIDSETHAGRQALSAPLFLLGTPGPMASGVFYEAIHDPKSNYRKFHWDQKSNVLFPRFKDREDKEQAVQEWLQYLVDTKFGSWENSEFRREYQCEWVSDVGALMFHLSEDNNYTGQLPPTRNVLGIDFGWHDASAWEVVGYDQYAQKTYHLHEFQKSGLTVDGIIRETIPIVEKYKPERIVCDTAGAGKIITETLAAEIRRRYGIPVTAADKNEKAAWVRLLDSDLRMANTFVKHNGPTWQQLSVTIWDDKASKEKEGQKCDCLDAFLYAWRWSYSYLKKVAKPQLTWEERMFEASLRRAKQNQEETDLLLGE